MNAKSIPLGKCPVCGVGDVVLKNSRKKRSRPFYGCSRYPECEFTTWDKPLEGRVCPKCGKLLLEKSDKEKGKYIACSSCDYIEEGESKTA